MESHHLVKLPHSAVLPPEHIYRIRVFLILGERESSDSTTKGCGVLEYEINSRTDEDGHKDRLSLDGLNFVDLGR
jgi:hypothetical protein